MDRLQKIDRQTNTKIILRHTDYIICGNRFKKSINCWAWDKNVYVRWMKRITWDFFSWHDHDVFAFVWTINWNSVLAQFRPNLNEKKTYEKICANKSWQLSNHKLNKKSLNIIIVRFRCAVCFDAIIAFHFLLCVASLFNV